MAINASFCEATVLKLIAIAALSNRCYDNELSLLLSVTEEYLDKEPTKYAFSMSCIRTRLRVLLKQWVGLFCVSRHK